MLHDKPYFKSTVAAFTCIYKEKQLKQLIIAMRRIVNGYFDIATEGFNNKTIHICSKWTWLSLRLYYGVRKIGKRYIICTHMPGSISLTSGINGEILIRKLSDPNLAEPREWYLMRKGPTVLTCAAPVKPGSGRDCADGSSGREMFYIHHVKWNRNTLIGVLIDIWHSKRVRWIMRSECGVWKMRSVENAECGNFFH